MATITVLGDIIIPKDDRSGSASDAKVPAFIEFIVKDMPEHQTPMRGGLRWLDLQCLNRYSKTFVDASSVQQIEMVTEIAYPKKSALNKYNQAHDCKNLFVDDAAPFVQQGDKNATWTILALSMRTAEYILSQRKKTNV